MKTYLRNLIVLLGVLFLSTAYGADESTVKAATFKPFELVGDWDFTNASSGIKYHGDVKVSVTSIDSVGLMRGTISYDGRQTNDACSTRGVFSDDPVAAEIIKEGDGYKISFMVKCARGESPRLRSWALICEGGVCTRPEVAAHGKGRLALKEVR